MSKEIDWKHYFKKTKKYEKATHHLLICLRNYENTHAVDDDTKYLLDAFEAYLKRERRMIPELIRFVIDSAQYLIEHTIFSFTTKNDSNEEK